MRDQNQVVPANNKRLLICGFKQKQHYLLPAKHRGFLDFPMSRMGSFSVPDIFAHRRTVARSLLCFPPLQSSPLRANVLLGRHL